MTFRKNVSGQHIGFQLVSSTDGSPITATASGNIVIDGAAQSALTGVFTHRGNGQYDYAPTQGETNGTTLSFQFTATGAIRIEKTVITTALDPTDAVRFGMTALPNAASGAAGGLRSTITMLKNTALANFPFIMLDSSGTPKTGLTITSQRSLDGAALGSCTNSASELSNGIYLISISAADTNANTITFRFSGSGAVDTFVVVTTNS